MNHRYHIESERSYPPQDWAPGASDDWDDDDGSMRLSAMAILSILGWLIGIAMGWLIWG